jgi:dipeptidyl aminopeptidase/acylaminoacyl peptidase
MSASTREFYLDQLLSLPGLWSPQVSRDGRWVAWSWFRVGPAADVFAAPTDGSAPPLRLTGTPDNTFLVSWTPDSRAVIVEQDRDGNERAQLFRVDLERPLEMVALTMADPGYFIRGGQLHPDGRRLIYGANYDFDRGQEIEPTWMYCHDLQTGRKQVLARPEKGAYTWPDLSPTGDHILYTRMDRHPSGRQLWLVDIDGHNDREIINLGDQVKAFASWFPDSRRLLVIGETDTHRRLGVWSLEDEALHWFLDDPGRNIENAYAPFGSRQVVLIETERARSRAALVDPSTGQETRFARPAGSLLPLAPADGGGWVGQFYSSRQPADVVRFDPADPRPEAFTSLSRIWDRTALQPEDLAQADSIEWPSVDGLAIQGWLYRPQGKPQGTVVYVHGGPTWHSQDQLNNQIQFLVNQGFNVLDPNYRGSTGFDLAFREAIKVEGWGGLEQADIRAGIEALIERGIAEPGRVGITGTSYGGYSSWCAITRYSPDIVAAAAPVCGMTDLVVDYNSTRPDLRPYSEEMMGGSPAEAPERYHERSPINHVGNIRGRLLIVQGGQDPNVTPANVEAVIGALEAEDIPYEILTFDDEGHGISKPANQRVLYLRLADFFRSAFGAG